jgi:hypothetical protein
MDINGKYHDTTYAIFDGRNTLAFNMDPPETKSKFNYLFQFQNVPAVQNIIQKLEPNVVNVDDHIRKRQSYYHPTSVFDKITLEQLIGRNVELLNQRKDKNGVSIDGNSQYSHVVGKGTIIKIDKKGKEHKIYLLLGDTVYSYDNNKYIVILFRKDELSLDELIADLALKEENTKTGGKRKNKNKTRKAKISKRRKSNKRK